MQRFSYLLFAGIGHLIALLPFRVIYFISDLLYYIVYYIVRYRRGVVNENLHNSFPGKTDIEIKKIEKKFYHHFCDILLEIVKLLHISSDEIIGRMKLKNPELFQDEYNKQKHILMIIGHYGNWEWGTAIGLQIPHKFMSIYKPLSNKYFDHLMSKIRSQFQGLVIPMKLAIRVFIRNMNEKVLTELNFIADQTPHLGEIEYWTTFLHQRTPVFLGIEKLAIKTRQPVFFAKIIKVKRGYYEVIAEKLCNDASILKPHEITELHVKALEKAINEAPEFWLWTHRRWKYSK